MSEKARRMEHGVSELRTVPDDIPLTESNERTASERRLAVAAMHARVQEITRLTSAIEESFAQVSEILPADSGNFADLTRRVVPRWHFPMLNDTERNASLAAAMERLIPPGSVVLDIGSGSGLLAMVAIRAGASRVYTCEDNPLLAEIARQVISGHGMSDVITVLDKRSTDLVVGRDLDRRVDVVSCEIVDCGLIGEGLLPTIRHAREHLLAPGGLLIPRSARLRGQLINSQAITSLNQVQDAAGFDVSLMNAFATRGHFPVRLGTWPHRLLSEPMELMTFDLARDPLTPGRRQLSAQVTESGEAHGLVAWFELDLGAGIVLRNSADNVSTHWMQALIPFEKSAVVSSGQRLGFELSWTDLQLSVR